MFAKTRHANWIHRLTLLYVSAVTLINERKRSAPQIERLLDAFQVFKDEPNESTVVGEEGYVAVRVHRTHGAGLGNAVIIVKVSTLTNTPYSLEPDVSVDFENPLGGWSHGRVLFVLNRHQASALTSVLCAIPQEE